MKQWENAIPLHEWSLNLALISPTKWVFPISIGLFNLPLLKQGSFQKLLSLDINLSHAFERAYSQHCFAYCRVIIILSRTLEINMLEIFRLHPPRPGRSTILYKISYLFDQRSFRDAWYLIFLVFFFGLVGKPIGKLHYYYFFHIWFCNWIS